MRHVLHKNVLGLAHILPSLLFCCYCKLNFSGCLIFRFALWQRRSKRVSASLRLPQMLLQL